MTPSHQAPFQTDTAEMRKDSFVNTRRRARLPKQHLCLPICIEQPHSKHACSTTWRSCDRWRPCRVECTESLPTSEVNLSRARLVLGWVTAREDLRVLPAYLHLHLLCLSVCVVNPCADDLYVSFCLWSQCCFCSCCGRGQSLHVSVWWFVCFSVCTDQQSRTYVCKSA